MGHRMKANAGCAVDEVTLYRRMKMSEEFIQWILIPILLIPVGWLTHKVVERVGA